MNTCQWLGDPAAEWVTVLLPGDGAPHPEDLPSRLSAELVSHRMRVARLVLPATALSPSERDRWLRRFAFEALNACDSRPRRALVGISRGARVSAAIAREADIDALVAIAYPFHPRQDPSSLDARDALAAVPCPTLLCQGTRDAYGNRQQVRGYRLPPSIRQHWMDDLGHHLLQRDGSATPIAELASTCATFLQGVAQASPARSR